MTKKKPRNKTKDELLAEIDAKALVLLQHYLDNMDGFIGSWLDKHMDGILLSTLGVKRDSWSGYEFVDNRDHKSFFVRKFQDAIAESDFDARMRVAVVKIVAEMDGAKTLPNEGKMRAALKRRVKSAMDDRFEGHLSSESRNMVERRIGVFMDLVEKDLRDAQKARGYGDGW